MGYFGSAVFRSSAVYLVLAVIVPRYSWAAIIMIVPIAARTYTASQPIREAAKSYLGDKRPFEGCGIRRLFAN